MRRASSRSSARVLTGRFAATSSLFVARSSIPSFQSTTCYLPISLPSSFKSRTYNTETKNVDDQVQQAINKIVTGTPCVVFMKGTPSAPQCGFSGAVVKILNTIGAKYDAYDVLENPALREGVKKYSDWPTIPQIFLGGEFVGGCDIIVQHFKAGELVPMLEKVGALEKKSA